MAMRLFNVSQLKLSFISFFDHGVIVAERVVEYSPHHAPDHGQGAMDAGPTLH